MCRAAAGCLWPIKRLCPTLPSLSSLGLAVTALTQRYVWCGKAGSLAWLSWGGGLGLEGILLSPSPPKSSWAGETGTGAVACGPLCPLLALSDDVSFVLGVLGLSVPLLKWAPRVGVGQTRAAFLGRRHTCLRKLLPTLLRAEGGLLLAEVTVFYLPAGSR